MSPANETLASLLSASPLDGLIAVAATHGEPVLLVGGAIRDALLGRSPADFDLAVAGDLERFVDEYAARAGRRPVAIGDPWRDTRRLHLDDRQIDIGRMLGSIDEDLAQRDFTINALAIRLDRSADGDILDRHGGLSDLEARTIRMVSTQALTDDPLRTLRALRYYATLDGFAIDAGTEDAIRRQAPAIEGVAGERVQTEWRHLLDGPRWAAAVERVYELGLGRRTLIDGANLLAAAAWNDFEPAATTLAPADRPVVRLAALLCGVGAVADDLIAARWPAAAARRAARVADWAMRLPEPEQDAVGWAIEDRDAAGLAALLGRALAPPADCPAADELELFAARAAEPRWVVGGDLISWGMGQGPELGALLEQAARGQIERRWDSSEGARTWARDQAVAATARGRG